MKLLLIKTSSMGDVIHALPALSDATQAVPGLQVDWVVEPAFAAIAALHPAVRDVIPMPLRELRHRPWALRRSAMARRLGRGDWTLALDAQGLMKTGFVARAVDCTVHGFDATSAREGLAAGAYDMAHAVPRERHAIERLRQLFAAALDYPHPAAPPDFGLTPPPAPRLASAGPYVVLLHGTNWRSKRWADSHWAELARQLLAEGWRVLMPAHTDREYAVLRALVATAPGIEIMLRPGMDEMIAAIAHAAGVVGVDTGLAHLAGAFGTPTVALFGPTSPTLTGLTGRHCQALAATMFCSPCVRRSCPLVGTLGGTSPCMAGLAPEAAAATLRDLVEHSRVSDAHRLSAV